MIIAEFLLGAVIAVFLVGLCGFWLIRDTLRWEAGTRLGTVAMWALVCLAGYIIISVWPLVF